MQSDVNPYDELRAYTLSLGDPSFIHQHVVDAFAAQNYTEKDKPITLTYALVGLYLHVEKHFTGKQVQLAHTKLAQKKRTWPAFVIPADRGSITVQDVAAASAGPARDQMIDHWCESVWSAYSENHQTVVNLLNESGIT